MQGEVTKMDPVPLTSGRKQSSCFLFKAKLGSALEVSALQRTEGAAVT